MLKEIFEQPGCIHDCMRGRINVEGTNVVLSAVIDYKERLLAPNASSSWHAVRRHAALIGKHLIESFCRIPVEVEYASEFRYRDPVIDSNDVVIAISQSGETADTLAAVELAKPWGIYIRHLQCRRFQHSPCHARVPYIHVGPEIGVASTKAFTGQVTVLYHAGPDACQREKTMDEGQYLAIVKELGHIPDKMEEVLKLKRP